MTRPRLAVRRTLVLAAVAAAVSGVVTPGTAAACRPEQFPYCQSSYCRGLAVLYGNLTENIATDPPLPVPPAWPQTGVAGCP